MLARAAHFKPMVINAGSTLVINQKEPCATCHQVLRDRSHVAPFCECGSRLARNDFHPGKRFERLVFCYWGSDRQVQRSDTGLECERETLRRRPDERPIGGRKRQANSMALGK